MEFCNTDFDNFCKEHGILRHRTVRNTPQQNGVAERMNRTLLEKVRGLLFTSGLPKAFWGEALYSATYLINRSPNRTLEFKTPIEVWTNRKPDLNHLRIFGCAAYAHHREGKLDPRSIRCVLVGYQQQQGTKGYRLWDRDSKGIKIIISRDVVFDEKNFPCKLPSEPVDTPPNESAPETESPTIQVEPSVLAPEPYREPQPDVDHNDDQVTDQEPPVRLEHTDQTEHQ